MYKQVTCGLPSFHTSQQFIHFYLCLQAAKWYQKAADGGHPTATYNLAVFYAHGWGGLEASTGKARELLKAAAALGQSDAAAALGISKETLPPSSIPGLYYFYFNSFIPFTVDKASFFF